MVSFLSTSLPYIRHYINFCIMDSPAAHLLHPVEKHLRRSPKRHSSAAGGVRCIQERPG